MRILKLMLVCCGCCLWLSASALFAQENAAQKSASAKPAPSKPAPSKTPYLNHLNHTPLESDYSRYPLDPRKPCNSCVRPCDPKAIPAYDLPGLRGRPYQEQAVGGRNCGKKSACAGEGCCQSCGTFCDKSCGCKESCCHEKKKLFKSVYWPVPRAALRENFHPRFAAWADCKEGKIDSFYNKFGNFRLINYQRTDSGYAGGGRDPYGCLGESKALQAGVAGLQFRQPGQPAFGFPVSEENSGGQDPRTFPAFTARRPSPSSFDRPSSLR